MADLRLVGRDQPADERQDGRGPGVAVGLGQGLVARQRRPERLRPAVLRDEPLGGADDLERPCLALVRGVAPGRDAVPAEDHPDRPRVGPADGRDVQAQLEAGPSPVDPRDPVAEAAPGERLTVGGRRQRDPRVRVEVVDVAGLDQPVHRGVDRRRGAAPAVEAEVEGGDHLVLALDARVDVDERAQAVEAQDGETGLGQGAEVAPGALDPQELDRRAGDRVDGRALGGRVAAGVVGVARVGPQAVRPLDERRDRLVRTGRRGGRAHAPQPACCPPTRSATIVAP